ncbi:Maintenance of mitochondrial morphology protein 1 [Erysiphe necator]|nr:Maintenance of mitochondrial morphology protein 1 [Erysiphe necator]
MFHLMMPDHSPNIETFSSYSFIQGLLLGQLSIVFLIGAFIKFFIFGDPPSPETTASLYAAKRRAYSLNHKRSLLSVRSSAQYPRTPVLNKKRSSILRNPPPLTTNTILSKTYYHVNSHQPESLDWFNVLIAQTIAQFRADAQHDDAILTSLTATLNGNSRPDYLDEIKVTELSLGEEFPIFSNCRVIPVDEDGFSLGNERELNKIVGGAKEPSRLQARMDVDLNDFITLAVETKLLLNFPKPLIAVLPVALAVTIVKFSGTLSISFVPGNPQSATVLTFSFLDDYRLDLSIRSLVGSKSRLQDMPKIAQLVERRLKTWFEERVVEPVFQQIELPSLWPRKKNTRGGEEEVHPSATPTLGKERDRKTFESTRKNEDFQCQTGANTESPAQNQDGASVIEREKLRMRRPNLEKYTMIGSIASKILNGVR